MTDRSYRGLLWSLALVALFIDQSSKYLVFSWLYNQGHGGDHPIVAGAFDILVQFTGTVDPGDGALAPLRTWGGEVQPRVNHGALFGMASEHKFLANGVFAGISLVAASAIIWWSTRKTMTHDWLLCTALGLILGGTLGNLYDRLVFNGVRDFLHWHYAFEWPVFNFADCCLVVGACLLLTQALFAQPAQEPEPTAESAAVPAEAGQAS